jgi:hypothetical protein
MVINDALVNRYIRYYQDGLQHGGSRDGVTNVFRGAKRWEPFQYGSGPDGLGGTVRGVMRTMAPVLARGVSKFLLDTAVDYSKGDSLTDAAKKAILPALMNAVQGGSGRRKKRSKRSSSKKHTERSQTFMFGKGIKAGKRKSRSKTKKTKTTKKQRKTKTAKRSKYSTTTAANF